MKILLLSDSKTIFEKTKKIAKGWFELIWHRYSDYEGEEDSGIDIIIMHLDEKRFVESIAMLIMKMKGRVGEDVPILVILNGTLQRIYSILKAGAYDYITDIEDTQKYQQKIEVMILWRQYQINKKLNDRYYE